MTKEEVDVNKMAPSLPPNYVSLALLQERWLQRKRAEEDEKGRQKAQAESRNRENLKPVKGFLENPVNSKNREPRIVGNQVSNDRVDSRMKGKELHGVIKSVNTCGNKEGYYKKKTQWVKNGRKGEDKSYGLSKTEGGENSDQIQGKNRDFYGNFDGTASACMTDIVPETASKEFKPEKLISKSGGYMTRDRKKLRNNEDCGVDASGSKDKVKVLPENATRKEDLGVFRVEKFLVYGNELEQNGGGNYNECMMEVVHQNTVKEGALIGTGSSKGSEQFGGEVENYGLGKFEGADRIWGGNRDCDGSVEGTASVCVVSVVPETVSKDFKQEKLVKKSHGNNMRDRKNLRNNDCGVEACGSKDKVKVLPKNATRKEDSGVFGVKKFIAYELEQNGDDLMVEVVHKNMVKEGVLVGTGSSKGSEQLEGEVESYGRGKFEGADRFQGGHQDCNSSVEGTASVCVVDVVPETVSNEFKPEQLIRKFHKNMRNKKNLRNNGDCGGEASGSKDKVKLPENATWKEDSGVKKFPAYVDELEQNGGGGASDDFMVEVEVVHENMVKEGVLVGTGSSKGSEQFGGDVERKGRKLKVPKDKKNPQVEHEVLNGYNGRNLQPGRKGKEVQVYRRKEGALEDSGTHTAGEADHERPKITRSFKGLSLNYSRERKVTSSMGIYRGKGHYKMCGGNWEMKNPADNRFVWVKKGEISAPL